MYVSTFEVLLTLKSPAERRLRKNSIIPLLRDNHPLGRRVVRAMSLHDVK